MKTKNIFTVFLVVFVCLALIFMFMKNTGSGVGMTAEARAKEHQKQTGTLIFDSKSTGSTGYGDALIELTPRLRDKNSLVVNFRINTHSVSLRRYDLKEITTLEYGGKVIKPVKASRIGGHHSSGTIQFDTGGVVSSFTIRIKGLPKIEERVYEWNVS